MATTKKAMSNGKRDEVLVNFFTQQVSPTHMEAMEILLTLKYPIEDFQSFIDQVNNCKSVDMAVCQMLTSCFTATDFTIATPQSALEKFRTNVVTRYQTVFNQMNTNVWNTVNPNMVSTGVTNTMNMPNGVPFGQQMNQNTGVNNVNTVNGWNGTPNMNVPFGTTGNNMNQWNMNGVNTNMNTNNNMGFSFGTDACGMAAATFFCNCVMQGVVPQTAFFVARDREMQCRNVMPNFGNSPVGMQAQAVFAQQFIVCNCTVSQCTWSANFFIQCCTQNTVNTGTTNTVTNVTPAVTMTTVNAN